MRFLAKPAPSRLGYLSFERLYRKSPSWSFGGSGEHHTIPLPLLRDYHSYYSYIPSIFVFTYLIEMRFPTHRFAILFAIHAAAAAGSPERDADMLKRLIDPPKLSKRIPALLRRARFGCEQCVPLSDCDGY